MTNLFKRLLVEEEGQGITEYALILGLVVFGIWLTIQSSGIGDSIKTLFVNVKDQVDKCNGPDVGGCAGTGSTP